MDKQTRSIILTVFLTIIVIAVVIAAWQGAKWLLNQNQAQNIEQALENAAAETADTDQDGLPDIFEDYYRTDPQVADTDGDGTNDFDEIDLGRDPAVASSDGLSDEVKPKTGSAVTDTSTYTGKYLATLPDDASRNEILDSNRVTAFVELNSDPLLPDLGPDLPQTTTDAGKEAIEQYLGSISASHNSALKAVTNEQIAEAVAARLQTNSLPLQNVIADLESNLAILVAVEAPAEVSDLHQTLLQANRSLIDNTRLIANMGNDFVGGLVGSNNIDRLATVFDDISQQVAELEQKYEIE